jgi:hypothetical protein
MAKVPDENQIKASRSPDFSKTCEHQSWRRLKQYAESLL